MIPTQTPSVAARLDLIARVKCGFYPTPLEEMRRLREKIGSNCPRLFIKRDDYTGTGFGSNKLRKLDYAIARELACGTTTIVTIAGEKSNHARVTAAVCARFGLRCVLILNRAAAGAVPAGLQAASRYVYEMFGAEIEWVASREEREPAALRKIEALQATGEKAAYIPLGVSFPLGALGFVQAVREVTEQFMHFGVKPDYIFHSSTSGGTQAGLIVGCQLFGNPETRIIGVSPDDPAHEVAGRVSQIISGVYNQLDVNEQVLPSDKITVLDSYIGDGYGVETAASRAALKLLARTEAVILDPIYTAKAMAALLDWIEKGKLTSADTVLFWHTGGQLALFYAPDK